MPMNTTLVMMRSPPSFQPSSRFASHTWPTISAVVRLRLKPCCAVEQNVQSIAQPTWRGDAQRAAAWLGDEHHLEGLAVPARQQPLARAVGGDLRLRSRRWTSASSASCARKSLARSVIAREVGLTALVQPLHELPRPERLAAQLDDERLQLGPRQAQQVGRSVLSRLAFIGTICRAQPARAELGRRAKKYAISLRGVLGAVRAVHGVRFDALGEVGADGARRGLLRIGGAHDLAVLRDGVLAFEHLHEHRTRGHVADQVLEERTRAMHGVEAFGLALRQMHHAGGDDLAGRPFRSGR